MCLQGCDGASEQERRQRQVEHAIILRSPLCELLEVLVQGNDGLLARQAHRAEVHALAELLHVLRRPVLLLFQERQQPSFPELIRTCDVGVERRVINADDGGIRREEAAEVQLENGREGLLLGEVARGAEDDDRVVVLVIDAQLHDGHVAVLQQVVQGRGRRGLDGLRPRPPGLHHHEAVRAEHHLLRLERPGTLWRLLAKALGIVGLLHLAPGLVGAFAQEHHDLLGLPDQPQVDAQAPWNLEVRGLRAEHVHVLARRRLPPLGYLLIPLGEDAADTPVSGQAQGNQVRTMLLVQQRHQPVLVLRGAGLDRREGGVWRQQILLRESNVRLVQPLDQSVSDEECIAIVLPIR
mmetsp:Transcript_17240/g.60196  ORF Transcript_17240/g.60196 Transcript_17240/m.60196 type:complete len:352 (+) Transcript_17240:1214-2269(+)